MAQAIILLDDVDLARDPQVKTEATCQKRFTVEGREYELDLTAAHAREFDKDMARWVQVAHKPAGPPPPVRRAFPGRKPAAYYTAMQDYAKTVGIEIPVSSEGKNDYPRRLREMFDAHLEAHPGEVTW